MKEDRSKKAAGQAPQEKNGKQQGLRGSLRQTSPFALNEEERSEAAKAELAGGGEKTDGEPAEKKPEKKKRLLDRPSPFVLNSNDFAQNGSEEDLDAQLQFQETEAQMELPIDHEQ